MLIAMGLRKHVSRGQRWLLSPSSMLFKAKKVTSKRKIGVLILCILFLWQGKRYILRHPSTIPADATQLVYPTSEEDALEFARVYARRQGLPVYFFYPGNSGQLNNQLISLINALCIAKSAGGTVVTPYVFYGAESSHDYVSGRSLIFQAHRKLRDLFIGSSSTDSLVGDYLDAQLLNQAQPVLHIADFMHSPGLWALQRLQHVLVRKGEAEYYYDMVQERGMWKPRVHLTGFYDREESKEKRGNLSVASRRELDCNFNVADFFKGLPYRSGVNANFFFMPKLYRTHNLNCTTVMPYWLSVRRFIQPRRELRQLVETKMAHWGRILAIHLRLFPLDNGKFTSEAFVHMVGHKFQALADSSDHIYVAYSVTSDVSLAIVHGLRNTYGRTKVITAEDYGKVHKRGPIFDKGYAVPLIDMWTCVQSSYFIGRRASSLSVNVQYWRDAFAAESGTVNTNDRHDYRLVDFSPEGHMNPSDK